MQHPATPVSPVRSNATAAPPNVQPGPGRPATPTLGDLAERVGLSRLAIDLGYPVTAADILGGVQRALLDLAGAASEPHPIT